MKFLVDATLNDKEQGLSAEAVAKPWRSRGEDGDGRHVEEVHRHGAEVYVDKAEAVKESNKALGSG